MFTEVDYLGCKIYMTHPTWVARRYRYSPPYARVLYAKKGNDCEGHAITEISHKDTNDRKHIFVGLDTV
jgi:hypothetical protein